MVSDPIADFLARIRNAVLARKKLVLTSGSKMTKRIAEILSEAGYINGFEVQAEGSAKFLKISLRYDDNGQSLLDGLKRVSKPGLRNYCSVEDIPTIRNGMGLAVLSTSKGVMTGEQARKNNVGGEVLCLIW